MTRPLPVGRLDASRAGRDGRIRHVGPSWRGSRSSAGQLNDAEIVHGVCWRGEGEEPSMAGLDARGRDARLRVQVERHELRRRACNGFEKVPATVRVPRVTPRNRPRLRVHVSSRVQSKPNGRMFIRHHRRREAATSGFVSYLPQASPPNQIAPSQAPQPNLTPQPIGIAASSHTRLPDVPNQKKKQNQNLIIVRALLASSEHPSPIPQTTRRRPKKRAHHPFPKANTFTTTHTMLGASRLVLGSTTRAMASRTLSTSARRMADASPLPAKRPMGAFRGGYVDIF